MVGDVRRAGAWETVNSLSVYLLHLYWWVWDGSFILFSATSLPLLGMVQLAAALIGASWSNAW